MDIQGDYYWNVHRNNKNDCSINIPFKLIDANYTKQIETLSKYAEYQSANPVEQKLMLAYLLEQENANFQANELYNDLLKLEPENRLVKVIYSTFLARMDLMNEANTNLPKN
jgi:sugar diacid utilization regulator